MGGGQSTLGSVTEQEVQNIHDALQQVRKDDKEALRAVFKEFAASANKPRKYKVKLAQFCRTFHIKGPLGERLFGLLDKDRNGKLDYVEFVRGLGILLRASLNDKATLLFNLAVSKKNQQNPLLSKKEFIELLKNLAICGECSIFFLLKGYEDNGSSNSDSTAAEKAFSDCDIHKTGKVNVDNFKSWLLSCEALRWYVDMEFLVRHAVPPADASRVAIDLFFDQVQETVLPRLPMDNKALEKELETLKNNSINHFHQISHADSEFLPALPRKLDLILDRLLAYNQPLQNKDKESVKTAFGTKLQEMQNAARNAPDGLGAPTMSPMPASPAMDPKKFMTMRNFTTRKATVAEPAPPEILQLDDDDDEKSGKNVKDVRAAMESKESNVEAPIPHLLQPTLDLYTPPLDKNVKPGQQSLQAPTSLAEFNTNFFKEQEERKSTAAGLVNSNSGSNLSAQGSPPAGSPSSLKKQLEEERQKSQTLLNQLMDERDKNLQLTSEKEEVHTKFAERLKEKEDIIAKLTKEKDAEVAQEIAKFKNEFKDTEIEKEMSRYKEDYEHAEVARVRSEKDAEIDQLRSEKDAEIRDLRAKKDAEISRLKADMSELEKNLKKVALEQHLAAASPQNKQQQQQQPRSPSPRHGSPQKAPSSPSGVPESEVQQRITRAVALARKSWEAEMHKGGSGSAASLLTAEEKKEMTRLRDVNRDLEQDLEEMKFELSHLKEEHEQEVRDLTSKLIAAKVEDASCRRADFQKQEWEKQRVKITAEYEKCLTELKQQHEQELLELSKQTQQEKDSWFKDHEAKAAALKQKQQEELESERKRIQEEERAKVLEEMDERERVLREEYNKKMDEQREQQTKRMTQKHKQLKEEERQKFEKRLTEIESEWRKKTEEIVKKQNN